LNRVDVGWLGEGGCEADKKTWNANQEPLRWSIDQREECHIERKEYLIDFD